MSARLGGEEFVVLLEEVDAAKALLIAERLRNMVSEISIPDVEGRITLSIGISVVDAATESLDALIKRADSAMYLAKNNGRNNCHVAPSSCSDSLLRQECRVVND